MYLLDFLNGSKFSGAEISILRTTTVEYRLACSGEFFNRTVIASDWRKSDVTRMLLRAPFELFVVSMPFDAYPQELALRFSVDYVTEKSGNSQSTFLPDQEIVEDLCALLTLLARRLIAPVLKTKEQAEYQHVALGSFSFDRPMPLLPMPQFPAWRRRPVSIVTSLHGQEVISYDPPPVGVDPEAVRKVLATFAANKSAEVLLNAAKLYKTAMELIESRPDISYQLLISTAESLSNVALADYKPDEAEMIESKRGLLQYARECGFNEAKARGIALEACKDNPWSKKRFRQFLSSYASDDIWEEDPLFVVPENLRPKREDFQRTLGKVYDLRSQNLHAGSAFPRSIGVGTSPVYNIRDLPLDFLARVDIPAVAWFERVVFSAAQKLFAEETAAESAMPFESVGGSRRH
jgi:hypothetical protein